MVEMRVSTTRGVLSTSMLMLAINDMHKLNKMQSVAPEDISETRNEL
jgi:hypothetical protein